MAYDWKMERRLKGHQLLHQGWSQKQVAKALDVSPGAVSQWRKRVLMAGLEGLASKPHPGALSRLKINQRQELLTILALGAERFDFQGNHWTRGRVSILIYQRYGITLGTRQVGRILLKHGYRLCGRELTLVE